MADQTPASFLATLEQSAVLPPDKLEEARRVVGEARDAKTAAQLLCTRGLLTRWQAIQLLSGESNLQLGKYRLLDRLGQGAMGTVYLAEHVAMRRRVAIKTLPPGASDPRFMAALRAEARAIAGLDHRNIVHAFDTEFANDPPYIVMEYVAGRDLQKIIAQTRRLDFRRAADYLAQAAEGLAAAHEKGLLHRDIKPANILVDEQGTVKILDLGLAHFAEGAAAGAQSGENVLGTVDYVSPEQAMGRRNLDARSDIYSLGCTLYFTLAGRAPFPGGSLAEKLVKHQHEEPRSLLKLRPKTPHELVKICRRMMAKKPEERFASAAEAAAALRKWLLECGANVPDDSTDPIEEVSTSGSFVGLSAAAGMSSPSRSGEQSRVRPRRGSSLDDVPSSSSADERRQRVLIFSSIAAIAGVVVIAGIVYATSGGKPPADSGAVAKTSTAPQETPDPATKPPPKQIDDVKPPPTVIIPDQPPQTPVAPPVNPPDPQMQPTPPPMMMQPPAQPPTTPSNPQGFPPRGPSRGTFMGRGPPPMMQAANPFRNLPVVVDLPLIAADGSAQESLGPVTLSSDASVLLSVSTPAGGRNPPSFTARGVESADQPVRQWQIILAGGKADAQESRVALVSIERDELRFQWTGEAAGTAADQLRNGVLRLKSGDRAHAIVLRKWKEVPPLVLNIEGLRPNTSFDVDYAPDAENLFLKLTRVEVDKLAFDIPIPIVPLKGTPKEPTILFGPMTKRGETVLRPLGIEITASFRPSPKASVRLEAAAKYQLSAGKWTVFQSRPLTDYANQVKAQQQALTAQVQSLEKSFDPAKKDQGAALRKAQLTPLDNEAKRIDALSAASQAVHQKAKLHFRLFTRVDDMEIDLVRTIGAEPPKPPGKK